MAPTYIHTCLPHTLWYFTQQMLAHIYIQQDTIIPSQFLFYSYILKNLEQSVIAIQSESREKPSYLKYKSLLCNNLVQDGSGKPATL